jgi:type II restriction/modification system DNA methylase subunit YeeA
MTAEEFVAKWSKVDRSECRDAQAHFLDLCDLVGHPKPQDIGQSKDVFTFEKGVTKHGGGEGWADVWKKDFFGWEYKSPGKDLDAAYDQLLQYRADLENPPLLVVSDMDIIRVHTNFNNAPTRMYEITLATLDQPRSLEILRAVFLAPDKLRPGVTSEAITEKASGYFATIARSMCERGLDPQAVAHFLVRVVFCLFAEDVGLLERGLFTRLVTKAGSDPKRFARLISELFSAMSTGGDFLLEERIRYFNGSLFDDAPILELTADEIAAIGTVSGEDWSAMDVSISGTLFERGLNPAKRSQLGTHYTSRADIENIVEPVILEPLRREWAAVQANAESLLVGGKKKSRPQAEKVVVAFLERLKSIRVLDPAGGSGNFLYVTLQKLLELEKTVNHYLREHGFTPQFPQINPLQLYCIEIDPYPHDLSQTVVWIGYIQWLRANGYGFPAEPILKPLTNNFRCADALFTDWPEVDFIVSNPPFLGGGMIREELGDAYIERLFEHYANRVKRDADLCCYWFENARAQIEQGKCKRAGLLATQGIRGGVNRDVLKRIKRTGDIFFAESDRDWILAGATVHVSMVGFDNGAELNRILNGVTVDSINPNLTTSSDLTSAKSLPSNSEICFRPSEKGGKFELSARIAHEMLLQTNPNGLPNSDVIRRWTNGNMIVQNPAEVWIIDFGEVLDEARAAQFEAPFEYLKANVRESRQTNREERLRRCWWLHRRSGEDMRQAVAKLDQMICTPRVSKYRIFVWIPANWLPDTATYVFARSDDFFFGLLHSRFHKVWSLGQGTQVREKESGFRYTPTSCFETFPFPRQTPSQEAAIAAAAKELNEFRERWLNPPEWMLEKVLEFPGSLNGPWARYIDPKAVDAKTCIGTIRYPRREARDAECAAKLKRRTLTNLYNERPAWLDLAHRKLDAAVADAYGWPADLSDEQILERLLALNQERAAEEAKVGFNT